MAAGEVGSDGAKFFVVAKTKALWSLNAECQPHRRSDVMEKLKFTLFMLGFCSDRGRHHLQPYHAA